MNQFYDGRGSTRLTTDISKNILSSNVRDAFGRTVSTAGSTANVYGYHGAEGYRSDGDGPAGGEAYQKVGARYYDATFGRFITRDTDLSQNAYQYCEGDPINFSDPSGHNKKWWQFWKSDNYGPTTTIDRPGSQENQQTGALFQNIGSELKNYASGIGSVGGGYLLATGSKVNPIIGWGVVISGGVGSLSTKIGNLYSNGTLPLNIPGPNFHGRPLGR